MTPDILDQAEYLSRFNYRVVVPDLYRGKLSMEKEEAEHMMGHLDWKGAVDDVKTCATHLRDQKSKRVAVMGFCMGGALSLASATLLPSTLINVAIPFYGTPSSDLCDLTKIDVPVQGHFGSLDPLVGFSDSKRAEQLSKELVDSGVDFEINVHDKVGHAFMNDADESVKRAEKLGLGGFDQAVVQNVWKSTLTFLEYYMNGRGANLSVKKSITKKSEDPTLAGLSKSARKKELKRRANEAKKKAKSEKKKKEQAGKNKKVELDPTKYHENRMNWLSTVEKERNITMYPHKFDVKLNVKQFRDMYTGKFKNGEIDSEKITSVAGRVIEIREVCFLLSLFIHHITHTYTPIYIHTYTHTHTHIHTYRLERN